MKLKNINYFYFLIKLTWLFLIKKCCVAFKKYQIKYFIIILLATSAINMPPMHSICHLRFFCYWVDGKDHFKNDFKKSRTDLEAKSV